VRALLQALRGWSIYRNHGNGLEGVSLVGASHSTTLIMDEAGSILKLWDLNETDLEVTTELSSLLNSFSCSKDDSWKKDIPEAESLEKFCENCFAANDVDANWCIECGTAIIRTPGVCDDHSKGVLSQVS